MENKEDKKPFDLRGESKTLAIESVKLYQHLTEYAPKKEYNLSKQYLISSTRIGDLLRQDSNLEAYYAAKSAKYWLELLYNGHYIDDEQAEKMLTYLDPLVRILYVISHPESRKEKDTSSSPEPKTSAAGNTPASNTPAFSKFQKGGAR